MKKIKISEKTKNIIYFAYVSLFLILAIIGIIDQCMGFMVRDLSIGVGSFSIFGFIAVVLFVLFIVYKIIDLIRHKTPEEPVK